MILTKVISAPLRHYGWKPAIRRYYTATTTTLKKITAREWLKILAVVLIFALMTAGFSRLAHVIMVRIPLGSGGAGILYSTVFIIFLTANLSLVVPVPITMPVIIAAALQGNPLFVGLAAGVGSAIGECGGYLMGRLGHRVLIPENIFSRLNSGFHNNRLERDVKKHGPLAIGILALQPILPFDIAGLLAGSLKMKFRDFFIALISGRATKYVLIAYLAGILGYIPFLR